jgi:hypothetical protein
MTPAHPQFRLSSWLVGQDQRQCTGPAPLHSISPLPSKGGALCAPPLPKDSNDSVSGPTLNLKAAGSQPRARTGLQTSPM